MIQLQNTLTNDSYKQKIVEGCDLLDRWCVIYNYTTAQITERVLLMKTEKKTHKKDDLPVFLLDAVLCHTVTLNPVKEDPALETQSKRYKE